MTCQLSEEIPVLIGVDFTELLHEFTVVGNILYLLLIERLVVLAGGYESSTAGQ